MNASAKKDLPAPDPLDLSAAMRRRYQHDPEPDPADVDDATTPRRPDVATPERQEATTSRAHEVATPRRRDVTKPRSHDATPPRSVAPSVETSVALTVRFDPDAYDELDDWIKAVRRELGWRKLDKSTVVRALLTAAQTRADVRRALLVTLKSL